MTENSILFSLSEVWEFCLEKIYQKPQYIEGLIETFEKRGITKESRLLDAGCGSGFPALDLIERGYNVIGVDKSREMARQCNINAQKRGLEVELHNIGWLELSKTFGAEFDCVYCRGNSLVYANSWEQNWIVPSRSREEIATAIKNFFAVLKPGGFLYVDTTSQNEKPHEDRLGTVETERGVIELTWRVEHDRAKKMRTWTVLVKSMESGETREYCSFSYLINLEEIINFFQTAGFQKVEQDVKVKSEDNYDIFVAYK